MSGLKQLTYFFFVILIGRSHCQECGSVLTGSGTIVSPGHPHEYPADLKCSWTIEASSSDVVDILFEDFNIEASETCEYDFLLISISQHSERFCGEELKDVGYNGRIQVRGSVRLYLESDGSVQHRGFSLQYQVIPENAPSTPAPTTTPSTTLPPALTCDDMPCQNGGECMMIDETEFYCFCEAGFDGATCQNDIDECLSNPCENGGTCSDGVDSWSCECVEGYVGESCGVDTDECLADPCQNGGTCVDQVNSFYCTCTPGWTGWDCDTEVDECFPNPCENDGYCEDHVGYYTCVCHPKFTGYNCSTTLEHEPTLSPEEFNATPTPFLELDVTTTLQPSEIEESNMGPPKTQTSAITDRPPKPTVSDIDASHTSDLVDPNPAGSNEVTDDPIPGGFPADQTPESSFNTTNKHKSKISVSDSTNQLPVPILLGSVGGFVVLAFISIIASYFFYKSASSKIRPSNMRSTAAPY